MILGTSNMGSMKNETVKKIEVASASNSKPPQFDGKKGDKNLMWKMTFEADQIMKGLLKAFQPEFENKLLAKEKTVLNLSNKKK